VKRLRYVNAFSNAKLLVKRAVGNRTAAGFEEVGMTTVLDCRADVQESGRALQRAQQLYETGDAVVFTENVEEVCPGDQVTLEMDDGRTLEGSVEETRNLDRSLLIAL